KNGKTVSLALKDIRKITFDSLKASVPQKNISTGALRTLETGIIDRTTLSKTIINTDPSTEGPWITIFPSWSPDDTHIIYLASTISLEPAGTLSGFEIFILKKF